NEAKRSSVLDDLKRLCEVRQRLLRPALTPKHRPQVAEIGRVAVLIVERKVDRQRGLVAFDRFVVPSSLPMHESDRPQCHALANRIGQLAIDRQRTCERPFCFFQVTLERAQLALSQLYLGQNGALFLPFGERDQPIDYALLLLREAERLAHPFLFQEYADQLSVPVVAVGKTRDPILSAFEHRIRFGESAQPARLVGRLNPELNGFLEILPSAVMSREHFELFFEPIGVDVFDRLSRRLVKRLALMKQQAVVDYFLHQRVSEPRYRFGQDSQLLNESVSVQLLEASSHQRPASEHSLQNSQSEFAPQNRS